MKKSVSISTAAVALMSLTACVQTSSGGGGSSTPTPTPSYETLDSTKAVTSTLGGVSIRKNLTTNVRDVRLTKGKVTHNTGRTVVNDGVYTLKDQDGFNGGTTLTDGSSTLETKGNGFGGTYEYVRAYSQTYTAGGQQFDSAGIGGVITNASDVPTTGNAIYRGEASGLYIPAGKAEVPLRNGKSVVKADFAAGTADTTLKQFVHPNPATAPFDKITATGMKITGNRFSGGAVQTTKNGAAVNFTGANTTTTAEGAFFGYDAKASAPDEVGGVIYLKGDDAQVITGFIAD